MGLFCQYMYLYVICQDVTWPLKMPPFIFLQAFWLKEILQLLIKTCFPAFLRVPALLRGRSIQCVCTQIFTNHPDMSVSTIVSETHLLKNIFFSPITGTFMHPVPALCKLFQCYWKYLFSNPMLSYHVWTSLLTAGVSTA